MLNQPNKSKLWAANYFRAFALDEQEVLLYPIIPLSKGGGLGIRKVERVNHYTYEHTSHPSNITNFKNKLKQTNLTLSMFVTDSCQMTPGRRFHDFQNEFWCQINSTKSNVRAAYYFTAYFTLDEGEGHSYTIIIPLSPRGRGGGVS